MKRLISIPFLVASLACGTLAQASTISLPQLSGETLQVTVSARGTDAWTAVDQARSGAMPTGATWQAGSSIDQLPSAAYPIDLGNDPQNPLDPCRNACSPFYGGIYQQDLTSAGAPDWQTTPFWAVFAPVAGASEELAQAILSFDRPRSALSLLWGSADLTNRLEFLLGGAVVGTFWGSEFAQFGAPEIVKHPGQSAAHVSFAGLEFDSLRFSAYRQGGSFEFSNLVAPASVPLPAGAILLLSGLCAFVAAGRGRPARG